MPSSSSAVARSQLSLPEVSRRTGIAMPTILRLRRENPQRVPSTGSGSQRYFSEDVLSVLEELFQAERLAARPAALFSVPKAAPQPVRAAKPTPSRTPRPEVVASPAVDEKDLSRRLKALEQRQRNLAAEIEELLQSELRATWHT